MNQQRLTDHISHQFNSDLEHVRDQVMQMGGLVEQQIGDAVKALLEADSELAATVCERDQQVNEYEMAIDLECSEILAIRQPAATDLRLVLAVLKIITDLERMGDEAGRIARAALSLSDQEQLNSGRQQIKHLSKRVQKMVTQSLNAFARMNEETIKKLEKKDAKVDAEYEALIRQSITYMMEDPRTISRVIDLIWVARSLERIGDHAKNIAEYVVFLVQGEDVRHQNENFINPRVTL